MTNSVVAQTPRLKIGTLGAPSSSIWMASILHEKRFDLNRFRIQSGFSVRQTLLTYSGTK